MGFSLLGFGPGAPCQFGASVTSTLPNTSALETGPRTHAAHWQSHQSRRTKLTATRASGNRRYALHHTMWRGSSIEDNARLSHAAIGRYRVCRRSQSADTRQSAGGNRKMIRPTQTREALIRPSIETAALDKSTLLFASGGNRSNDQR
jgi:hypothetical protein